jgi:hypothetical protein
MGLFKYRFMIKRVRTYGGIDGFRSALSYFPESKLSVAITSNGMNYGNNDIVIAILSSYNRKFEIPVHHFRLKDSRFRSLFRVYASATFPLAITVTKIIRN